MSLFVPDLVRGGVRMPRIKPGTFLVIEPWGGDFCMAWSGRKEGVVLRRGQVLLYAGRARLAWCGPMTYLRVVLNPLLQLSRALDEPGRYVPTEMCLSVMATQCSVYEPENP